MQCSPKRHQLAGIIDSIAGFEKYDRGQLVMPWGTGRTLTTLWIAEAIDSQLTLVFLPSAALLRRTALTWQENCGDESRGQLLSISAEPPTDRLAWGHADARRRNSKCVPITMDIQVLCEFLRKPGNRIVFSTYASWSFIEAALTNAPEVQFDLIICDDADRCTVDQRSSLGAVLDGKRIRARRRLIVTEPSESQIDASRALVQANGTPTAALLGPRFHTLSFSRAAELGVFSREPAASEFVT